MQSELAQLRLERERRERRERDEKQLEEGAEEKEEEEEILTTPTSEKSLEDIQEEQRLKEELSKSIIIREEAREYINTSILRDIEETLGRTEGETFKFAQFADNKNVDEMMKSLESIHGELLHIKELLLQYQSILLGVHKQTSRIEDVNWIIKETFSPNTIKQQVHQVLEFLNGVSSALLNINLNVAGARKPVKLLQDIFNIGTDDFEFPYREIVIDMDISRDEEFALNLARTQERIHQEETPRFTSFPTRRLDSSRRDLSLTSTPSRPSLGIDEARNIVAENMDVDKDTLKAILEAQGFSSDIIAEALVTLESSEEVDILPPLKKRTSYRKNIEALSIRELVKIAKEHDLLDYRRKSKAFIVRYLEENLDTATLNTAIREILYPIKYTNLSVIFAS